MPYRVLPSGVIECDSLHEALEVQKAIGGLNGREKRHSATSDSEPPTRNVSESADYLAFWRELKTPAKAILRALAKNPNEQMLGDTLAKESGVPTQTMPGLMVHVRNAAKRFGIDEPVMRTQKTLGRRMKSYYQVSKELSIELENQLKKAVNMPALT